MARKKVLDPLRLEFKNYFYLLKISTLKPSLFSSLIPSGGKYQNPLLFFIVNFCILSVLPMIVDAALSLDPQIIFISISSTLFSIPIGLLGLFIISGFFFILAKLLGGQGSYKDSLNINSYSSLPLILTWIPYVSAIFYLLTVIILVLSFSRIFKLSKVRAGALIVFPILLASVLLIATGVVRIPSYGKIF